MNPGLEIIEEDKEIIVCRKPPGIPVQTAKMGQQDMVSLLKSYRAGKQEPPEVYVVHRLDQPVEGLMVFAKDQKAAASLGRQIQQKNVDKYYQALVEGVPRPSEGRLEDYLLRDGRTNTSMVVKKETKGAKRAVLQYQVQQSATYQETVAWNGQPADPFENGQPVSLFENGQPVSLLEIQLETGRHHQIRVQLAHAGYPLVGDRKYNPRCHNGYLPIGLCSVRLAFDHPAAGRRMEFSIEPEGQAFQAFYGAGI